MARLWLLIRVSRPVGWVVLPLVYCLGVRASSGDWGPAAILQGALLTFPMNLVGCGLNDVNDFHSDSKNPRKGSLWGPVIGPEQHQFVYRACLATSLVIMVGALVTMNWANIALTICMLLLAWAYSVPPLRLKVRPPLDSLANGVGFFLLPFSIGYSFGGSLSDMPVKYYFAAGCTAGLHALTTAIDYRFDKTAGDQTLAVAWGKRAAVLFACAMFSLTWLMAGFQGTAVRTYLGICIAVTAVAVVYPRERVILMACTTIFIGFVSVGALLALSWLLPR